MLTEHSGVLLFLLVEEVSRSLDHSEVPKLHSKPMVPASRGRQATHGATEETARRWLACVGSEPQ